ncbi:hypothetical protein G6F43_010174 [Rhizopus delemar]|nr:hypothetical protein G6F43_010174 [Rhizopus delemar]
MLTSKFAGLEIKKSRVHEFMRDECNLSLKQTTRWPEARANENNIQNRYDWVIRWSNTDMDFSKNCIFIDEAGFDLNMKPSRAWAPRGQMTVTISPTTRAPSHTIIGAISTVGVINLSIRVPKQPPKAQQLAITCRETLDILDKYDEMKAREKLKDTETLQERIADAANEVPIQHLENIIQHSKHQFENCLNHIPI